MKGRVLLLCVLALSAGVSGCRLEEVALPTGEDVLVVEAVLRSGARRQTILLHRSVDGRLIRGERDARVVVTAMAGGAPMVFRESDVLDCVVGNPRDWRVEDIQLEATCYTYLLPLGRAINPGETFELRIETTAGEVARGRTTVPEEFALVVPAVTPEAGTSTAVCMLPDSAFEISWTRSRGAWSYLASLRITNWGDDLRRQGVKVPEIIELVGVSVSDADTTLLFPTNLGVFQRAEYDQRLLLALQDGVPSTADATFALLALDRNYTNAIRGGRFNPSGNIKNPSVVGQAVGVFGSVVPILIRSPGSSSPPRPERC